MRHIIQPENANTVRRRLRLAGAVEPQPLTNRLQALEGVKWLELNDTVLTVAYDFTRLDYDGLCSELRELGAAIDESGLHGMRAAWYRFTDANARDNAQLKPTCCSKPPKK